MLSKKAFKSVTKERHLKEGGEWLPRADDFITSYMQQVNKNKADREREAAEFAKSKADHTNVMRASASLGETSMLPSLEDGLGIESSTEGEGDLGGSRKRRKKQDTGGGLGIG